MLTGIDAGRAVFHLGHYTLFVLLLGFMGAMDRHGAGGHAMVAMGLGLGLFAKTFDSGFPSVASQLGLVVGVLVLFRHAEQRHRHHTLGLCLALFSVALIHPTGAIYLALLLLSHVMHGLALDNEEHQERLRRLAYIASAFITLGLAVALLVMALDCLTKPSFLNTAGRAVNRFSSTTACCLSCRDRGRCWSTKNAGRAHRHHVVRPALGVERGSPHRGLAAHSRSVPVVLHALFHGPSRLPCTSGGVGGVVDVPHTALTPVDEDAMPVRGAPPVVTSVLLGLVVLGAIAAQTVAFVLADHEELLAVSPGDLALREALENVEGAVYTENMHWGYVWNAPAGVEMTSIPTLGLVHLDSSQHAAATQAMFYDNTSYFIEHDMLHALTSPMGTMQWTLAASAFWGVEAEVDGRCRVRSRPDGDAKQDLLAGIDEDDCTGCVARLDPWRDHKFRDPLGLGDDRPFLPEGTDGNLTLVAPAGAERMCLTYEVVGSTGGLFMRAVEGLDRPYHGLRTDAGYHQACVDVARSDALRTITFEWDSDEPQRWHNPLGLSGRDTVLLDRTGVKLHWFTYTTAN